MRWLVPSLLLLSLVFSTGGVAIVGHADSARTGAIEKEQSPAPAATAAPAMPLPNQCSPATAPRRPSIPKRTGARPPTEGKSIVLNTSGYNYPLEGEWHPDPVAKPTGVPKGVLPEDLEVTPPAAPAPK